MLLQLKKFLTNVKIPLQFSNSNIVISTQLHEEKLFQR